MKITKKSLVMMMFAFVIICAGLVAPKDAEAFGLVKSRTGYFSNYVETQNYYTKWTSNTKQIALLSGSINATSSAKGTFKLYIQIRPNNTGSWKTIKTITANKNGTTRFESPKFSPKDGYRFKLVNEGTKNRVNYKMSWIPFGY